MQFLSAPDLRRYLKERGFTDVKVRYSNNPFGGEGKFFVELTSIPEGVALIHSSGPDYPTTTYGNNPEIVGRIARLREILHGTNAAVNH